MGAYRYIKIEELAGIGDMRADILAAIFDDVARIYAEQMGEALHISPPPENAGIKNDKVVSLDDVRKQRTRQQIRDSELQTFEISTATKLIDVFHKGRVLDHECIASRFTAQYFTLKCIVNQELSRRGFSDIQVY
ncbi:MAG TPA: hypothetical protein PKH37_06875 [Alphaproteobacteria bacterium]|nr:hypothetical protein [Alphaproteobacteria bacterium]